MKFKNLLLSIPLGAGLVMAGCSAEGDPPPEDENNMENIEEQEDNQEPDVTEEPSEEKGDEEEPDIDEEPSEEDNN